MAGKRLRNLIGARCPQIDTKLRAVFECAFAILAASRNWKASAPDESGLFTELSRDLRTLRGDVPDAYDRVVRDALKSQPLSIKTLALSAHIAPKVEVENGVDTEEEEQSADTADQNKRTRKKEHAGEIIERVVESVAVAPRVAEKKQAARPTEATKRSAIGSKC